MRKSFLRRVGFFDAFFEFQAVDIHVAPTAKTYHNMTAEIADMSEAILKDLDIELDAAEGANTVAVCLAAVKSAAEGKAITPKYYK